MQKEVRNVFDVFGVTQGVSNTRIPSETQAFQHYAPHAVSLLNLNNSELL